MCRYPAYFVCLLTAVSLGAEELVVDLMGEDARAGSSTQELGTRVMAALESPDPFSSPAQGKEQQHPGAGHQGDGCPGVSWPLLLPSPR